MNIKQKEDVDRLEDDWKNNPGSKSHYELLKRIKILNESVKSVYIIIFRLNYNFQKLKQN